MPDPRDYLLDPDEQMERMSYPWSEPVEADSDKEAEETCQELADEYDVDLIDVEERSKNWWDCIFS